MYNTDGENTVARLYNIISFQVTAVSVCLSACCECTDGLPLIHQLVMQTQAS